MKPFPIFSTRRLVALVVALAVLTVSGAALAGADLGSLGWTTRSGGWLGR
jgi:hypothetical protein